MEVYENKHLGAKTWLGCPVHFGAKYIFLAQKYRKLMLKI